MTMGNITLKVDSAIFSDMRYCKLSDAAKATFWGILAVAGMGGIEVERFQWISHAGARRVLNSLRDAGFITLETRAGGVLWIVPTGRGAKRHVDTARIKQWRRKKRAERAARDVVESLTRPVASIHKLQPPQAATFKEAGAAPVTGQSATSLLTSGSNLLRAQLQTAAACPERSPFDEDDWDAPLPQEVQPVAQAALTHSAATKAPAQPANGRPQRSYHEEGILEIMIEDGVDKQTAQNFLRIRETKFKPLFTFGWDAEKEKVAEVGGCTIQEAIKFACIKCWATLNHAGFRGISDNKKRRGGVAL